MKTLFPLLRIRWSFVATVVVGNANLILIDRESCANSFHCVCDEYSGELESVAAFVCDKSGKANHSLSIHGLDNRPKGGFLFIQSFRINYGDTTLTSNDDDKTFVGAMALRQILNSPALQNKWSLAVYVPEAEAQMNETTIRATRPADYDDDEETRDSLALKRATVVRCCKKDARQFFRAGFQQITPPSLNRGDYYHLFAVPSFVQGISSPRDLISHCQALELPIVDPPERPLPPTGLDLQILELVQMEMTSGVSSLMIGLAAPTPNYQGLKTQLRQLIAQGGSIERSHALHTCATCEKDEVIDILLRLAGSNNASVVAINAWNDQGETPLMLAAEAATSNYLFPNPYGRIIPSPVGICDRLIAQGASKNKTDVSGLTALGRMRKKAMEMLPYSSNGYQTTMTKIEHLTRLLMPTTGPTLADNAVLMAATNMSAGHAGHPDDYGDY